MNNPWIAATSVAPSDLGDATLQLHWATQLVASAGQTFVEPRPDDSHRSMTWSPGLRSFVSDPFAGPYPFRLAVRPADLTLFLVGREDDELGVLPLAGKTLDEAYAWFAVGMATYLGGAPPTIERPEYDMPEHPVMDSAPFSAGMTDELTALEAMFSGAGALLDGVVSSREDASPVRVWPHHFDIATLITIEQDANGKATKTLGIGFAPMGGGYSEWYGYVSPWPWPEAGTLPGLEGAGFWHTDGWTGAVLPGADVAAAEPGQRAELVEQYLAEAIDKAISVLV